ncbi:MAG TPA: dUTP diphosphatase [Sphaerochaeta sp.]|jgi:dUTP pyrophosphatase|nr:dUTP diphosphatase [Sphaerochaeta sp.]HOR79916.1 dUTP diphosphatase [Sphaerochaeta sp.]HPK63602.1 dUTP diphosphatase [Sphaerochaeta sp.]HRV24377.1 dUTP diphosphatase [Sphaerochaeta sp.]
MIAVKVLALKAGASLPAYQTAGSAGADLKALLDEPVVIEPGNRALIPTGIALELPVGYEAQIRPRSGLAAKAGLTVLNAPGTIDSDYRGEVTVILINHGSEAAIVRNGDRIAQLVIAPVVQASFSPADALDSTERGSGGFGSTGV